MKQAKIFLPDSKEVELPIIEGTCGPDVIDVSKLYEKTGIFTYDNGFQSTASCKSSITFVDGEKGELRYRGYSIDSLIDKSYSAVVYLLLYGELSSQTQLNSFECNIKRHCLVPEQLLNGVLAGFPRNSHPMAILMGCFSFLSAFYYDTFNIHDSEIRGQIAIMAIAKVSTLVAAIYKHTTDQSLVYPSSQYCYVSNFLHMMFSVPTEQYKIDPVFVNALTKILALHIDHEQNASTSIMRMCGSSGASPFACVGAAIASLWGPSHGGANEAVIKQLYQIGNKNNVCEFVKRIKDPGDGLRLMGFGHRVYKNFDPRAVILRKVCADVIANDNIFPESRGLLEIAVELERIALQDEYFVGRKLYPNVDFYSGIILLAMGIPINMFTMMFALARTVGWIAQWSEMFSLGGVKIARPRQLYVGNQFRDEHSSVFLDG